MKILFFIDSLQAGGQERMLVELIKGLKSEQNIYFELIVMNKNIHYQEVLDLGIKIHYVIRKTKRDISVFNNVYKICKQYKPDILHSWDSMTAIYSLPAVKLLRIKFMNGMVSDAPEQRNIFNKSWLRGKISFFFSNVVVGNSLAGLKAYSPPKAKSLCIYNGYSFSRTTNLIDDSILQEVIKSDTKYIVGMVATFSRYKDYKTYFEAAQMILKQRKDVTFLAIGTNTDSNASKELVKEEFKGNIRLLGKRSGIESFVNKMDIGVLSTFTEGISNSILEYMAMGKPVIATSGGGTCEVLKDKETGFLVSRSNVSELAERIELLLDNADLRTSMGLAGKKRVKDFFSIEKMIHEFVVNYNRLLKLS